MSTTIPQTEAAAHKAAIDYAWTRYQQHPLLDLISHIAVATTAAAQVTHTSLVGDSTDLADALVGLMAAREAAEREAIRVLDLRGEAGAHVLQMARARGGLAT